MCKGSHTSSCAHLSCIYVHIPVPHATTKQCLEPRHAMQFAWLLHTTQHINLELQPTVMP